MSDRAATVVRTRDGDTLDAICWRYYGSEQLVPQVLAANPGLAALPEQLPAGIVLTLPAASAADLSRPAVTVRLWGEE